MILNKEFKALTTVLSDKNEEDWLFTAVPPDGIESMFPEIGMNPFTHTLLIFWHMAAVVNPPPEEEENCRSARRLLPILTTIVADIEVSGRFDEGTRELVMYYNTLIPKYIERLAGDGTWYEYELKEDRARRYNDELRNSYVFETAMRLYLDHNRSILMQEAETNANLIQSADQNGEPVTNLALSRKIWVSWAKPSQATDEAATPIAAPTKSKGKRHQVRNESKPNHIRMGLHSISPFFRSSTEKGAAPALVVGERWAASTGESVQEALEYGLDLTEIELRVLMGLIGQLSDNNYQGNLPPVTLADIVKRFSNVSTLDQMPALYKEIKEIPKLKVGQRELTRLAGMDYDNQGDAERVAKAIGRLGSKQFCYLYRRAALDANGKPIVDPKTKKYRKELVEGVDTIFTVRTVMDEQTNAFRYYEISPSALFLEQKESYYMLIPRDWQEEVRRLVGSKRGSSDTLVFLLYLRYRFELIRRQPNGFKKSDLTLRMSWVGVANAMRMPEYYYTNQRARAQKKIENAYAVAYELGYLTDYSRGEKVDVLVLNPAKYPQPQQQITTA